MKLLRRLADYFSYTSHPPEPSRPLTPSPLEQHSQDSAIPERLKKVAKETRELLAYRSTFLAATAHIPQRFPLALQEYFNSDRYHKQ